MDNLEERGVECQQIDIGSLFSFFKEFKRSLDDLKKEGHHPFHVFNSQTGKDYNQKRAGKKFSNEVTDTSKFEYTYYSVRCVHYNETRSCSKGLHPNQCNFSLGCEAKITVTYDRLRKKLNVIECNLDHNHCIGESIVQHYPTARRLNKEEEQDVKEIMQLRPNKKLIRNLIAKKYGKQLTLKDIHNIKAKTKESCGNQKDAQIVLDKLTEALKVDSKAAGGVVVDENDTLAILFYQSRVMRNMFSKFPEIMFIDGTYNVNKLGMPLYYLMVEDGFGHGKTIFMLQQQEKMLSICKKL